MPKDFTPSYAQFKEQWKSYSVIPFILRFKLNLKDVYPPYYSYNQNLKENFLLDGSGRYSFFPLSGPSQHYIAPSFTKATKTWKLLQQNFKQWHGPKLPSNFPPFYGGAVGVLSYDAGRIFEKGWKSSPPPNSLKLPLIDFYIYDDLACYDKKNQEMFIISCLRKKKTLDPSVELYNEQIRKILNWKTKEMKAEINFKSAQARASFLKLTSGSSSCDQVRVKNKNSTQYIRSLDRIKQYIAQGDIYQANLSQRIEWKSNMSPEQFYLNLRTINPSPYACLWKTPAYSLASCSPELLLKKRGNYVETRPLAGTRPRGKDPKLDRILEGELILNEKERAEHIMLVDLERNDLGRVCAPGSVYVKKNMAIEKYSHVMHIVSYIEGKLKKSCNFFKALEALFPGGTITGCPKIRCMEILDELEPVRREIFYGSVGWIGYQGDGEMNILIRTAAIQKNKFTIQVGSGIVADSQPKLEFQESLHKARALLAASK